MRKFKFRAWDGMKKEMFFPNSIWLCDDGSLFDFVRGSKSICTCNHYQYNKAWMVLMEWTGLQDKRGKDIFEGDIVKTESPYPEIGIIKFGRYRGDFDIWANGFYLHTKLSDFGMINTEEWEVLSNIYENEDLIK